MDAAKSAIYLYKKRVNLSDGSKSIIYRNIIIMMVWYCSIVYMFLVKQLDM